MDVSICVISKNREIINFLQKDPFFCPYKISYIEDLSYIYAIATNELVDLIICDCCNNDIEARLNEISTIKQDPIFYTTGVVVVLPCDDQALLLRIVKEYPIDDYICLEQFALSYRVKIQLAIQRVKRLITANPLTKLPSGTTIQREVQKRLDERQCFAFAYADIDNFKAYNDVYGFAKGDEVIKLLGRIILNIVRSEQPKNSFVGHIGGDDFVYIVDTDKVEKITQEIVFVFSEVVKAFYRSEHLSKKYIETQDRQGNFKRYHEKKKIDTENINLEPFVVNLADTDSARYVKVTIQLEVNRKEVEQVRKKTGYVRDAIIQIISSKTYDELILNEGKMLLKDEIKTKLKRLFDKEDTIINVLFLDFIMQ